VGIFHEAYSVQSGRYETIYRAMPPCGLAAATDSVAPLARRGMTALARLATGSRIAASNRLAAQEQPAVKEQPVGMPVGCPHAAGMAAVPDSPAGLIARYDSMAAAR